MDYRDLSTSVSREQQLEASGVFPALMRKVYLWMTFALLITAFSAYYVGSSETLITAIVTNRAIFWGLIIAELALVLTVSAAINKLSLTVATLLFVLYSVVNGATLSLILMAYTASSVTSVFLITAGTFAAMALYGYFTKTNLMSWGKYLVMALIGLIIASVVNIFTQSFGLQTILNYAGVLIFVGLTAYDTQKIKLMLMQATDLGESAQKIALLGALELYLDFINLFIHLLRILGDRRD